MHYLIDIIIYKTSFNVIFGNQITNKILIKILGYIVITYDKNYFL